MPSFQNGVFTPTPPYLDAVRTEQKRRESLGLPSRPDLSSGRPVGDSLLWQDRDAPASPSPHAIQAAPTPDLAYNAL